jgi:hypothetical protein
VVFPNRPTTAVNCTSLRRGWQESNVQMDKEFDRLICFAKSFDSTGIGRLNLLLLQLAEVGLKTIQSEQHDHNPLSDEVFSPSEMAALLKISVRTFNDKRIAMGIEPDWGSGSSARYSREKLEQYKRKMKEP